MIQIFHEQRSASKNGIAREHLVFPFLVVSEVLGIISFYSHEIRKPDSDLLDMMTAIGSQIGLFIKRKQG